MLHEIFSPLTVTAMADGLVTSIAGESEESRAQRDQFLRQLEVLRNGLEMSDHYLVRLPRHKYHFLVRFRRALSLYRQKCPGRVGDPVIDFFPSPAK